MHWSWVPFIFTLEYSQDSRSVFLRRGKWRNPVQTFDKCFCSLKACFSFGFIKGDVERTDWCPSLWSSDPGTFFGMIGFCA